MQNPAWSSVIKLTQTISPTLLNETAFLYSGNKITLTPIAGRRRIALSSPAGGRPPASSRSPTTWAPLARDRAAGHTAEHNLELELLSLEERLRRVPVSGRSILDQGTAPVQVWVQLAARLQEPATAVQHPGNGNFQLQPFSKDSYINFLLGDASTFEQLNYLFGKHWVNNNYGFYVQDNWHVQPAVDAQPRYSL